MKNKFLVGTITFFATLIIIIVLLNFFDSSTKKNYKLDRKYEAHNMGIKFSKSFNKMSNLDDLWSINSDKLLVELNKLPINDSISNFTFYFDDLLNKETFNIKLPSSSNILFSSLKSIYYTKQFDFYECNLQNKISQIKFQNFKIISVIPAIESNTLLCFGELFQDNKYILGFFKANKSNGTLEISKAIEVNSNSMFSIKYLQYAGKFNSHENEKCISYTCDKYSKIYFFDNNSKFIKDFKTIDNLDLPEIVTNEAGFYFYSRKSTFNTNEGIFIKDGDVYVLSCFSEFNNKIIIDVYDFKNLKYKQSLKFNLNHFSAKRIKNVLLKNDKLIIALDKYYASFIFSRYI